MDKWQNKSFIFFSVVLILFTALSIIYLVGLSLHLRPIQDDYCLGSVAAKYGFFGAMDFWFNTWSGEYTGGFSNTLFVGIPLVYLPFELASASTFLFSLILMGIIGMLLNSLFVHSRESFDFPGALFAVLSPVLWIIFWWSTSLSSTDEFNLQNPRSITHWQNINSGYVIVLAVALIWFLLVTRMENRNRLVLFSNGVGIGVWVGGSGLVLSLLGVLVALIFLLLSLFSKRSGVSRIYAWFTGPWLISNTVGWILAFNSPGVRSRQEVISDALPDVADRSLGSFIEFVIPKGVIEWVEIVVSPGTVLVFLVAFVIGSAQKFSVGDRNVKRAFRFSAAFLLSSLVLNLVSQSASAFSYDSYWHTTSSTLLFFVSLLVLGLTFGKVSQTWMSRNNFWPRAGILLCTLVVSVGVLNTALVDVKERLIAWEAGPAPLIGMGDIEVTGGYIEVCWSELGEFRDTPDRGR
jgi:hypothetical protein